MRIQTLNHSYLILQILSERNGIKSMVAKKEQEEQGEGQYFILYVKEEQLLHKLIPFAMKLQQQNMFEDFIECFSKESDFYMVFRWHNQSTFLEKIDQSLRFVEKRIILRNILERFIVLKMPNYLMYEVLNFKNITIADSLSIEFHYELFEWNAMELIQLKEVKERLANVIKQLFAEEFQKEVCPDLKEFMEDLKSNSGYPSLLSIYQRYKEINQAYESGIEVLKQNGPKFQSWEKIKQWIPWITKILKFLLFLAILIYSIYILLNPASGNGEPYQFNAIGNLEIQTDEE